MEVNHDKEVQRMLKLYSKAQYDQVARLRYSLPVYSNSHGTSHCEKPLASVECNPLQLKPKRRQWRE